MTTLNLSVAANGDDKHEESGVGFVRDYTNLLELLPSYWAACRFLNVTIPAGSTILTAVFQGYINGASWDDPDVTLYCNDVDDAAALGSANGSLSGLARTTASATVDASGVGAGYYSFPDMTAVIQEVVDRAGWASGNALTVILEAESTCDLRLTPHNYNSAERPPLLDITYTAPGASNRVKLHALRQGTRYGAQLGT